MVRGDGPRGESSVLREKESGSLKDTVWGQWARAFSTRGGDRDEDRRSDHTGLCRM